MRRPRAPWGSFRDAPAGHFAGDARASGMRGR